MSYSSSISVECCLTPGGASAFFTTFFGRPGCSIITSSSWGARRSRRWTCSGTGGATGGRIRRSASGLVSRYSAGTSRTADATGSLASRFFPRRLSPETVTYSSSSKSGGCSGAGRFSFVTHACLTICSESIYSSSSSVYRTSSSGCISAFGFTWPVFWLIYSSGASVFGCPDLAKGTPGAGGLNPFLTNCFSSMYSSSSNVNRILTLCCLITSLAFVRTNRESSSMYSSSMSFLGFFLACGGAAHQAWRTTVSVSSCSSSMIKRSFSKGTEGGMMGPFTSCGFGFCFQTFVFIFAVST